MQLLRLNEVKAIEREENLCDVNKKAQRVVCDTRHSDIVSSIERSLPRSRYRRGGRLMR